MKREEKELLETLKYNYEKKNQQESLEGKLRNLPERRKITSTPVRNL